MEFVINKVLKFIEENDVKFIRLAFCDLIGNFKNIAIMPSELEAAFEKGVSIDGSAIDGFCDITQSDIFLKPDFSTMSVLPWRPIDGKVVRFVCDIFTPDGKPLAVDGRDILKRTVRKGYEMGYSFNVGFESEFYLFKTEDGRPTKTPIDDGGYLDMLPLDKGEDIRREICLAMQQMSLCPEMSHHEQGRGQNEIDFRYSDPLSACDNFLSFKSLVKAIAHKNGLFASFMPKPLEREAGNGLHINLSVVKNGENLFATESGDCGQRESRSFLAGILDHALELSSFLNPTPNSYKRLGQQEAPCTVGWSKNNRSQYIRIPTAEGDSGRMELRAADGAVNPYIALAAVLEAGLDGIQRGLTLPDEAKGNMYHSREVEAMQRLPEALDLAIDKAQGSDWLSAVFGKDFIETYTALLKHDAEKGDDALFKRL